MVVTREWTNSAKDSPERPNAQMQFSQPSRRRQPAGPSLNSIITLIPRMFVHEKSRCSEPGFKGQTPFVIFRVRKADYTYVDKDNLTTDTQDTSGYCT